MIEFKEFLAEGVYDRSVFKAFFLAGGPGSGNRGLEIFGS